MTECPSRCYHISHQPRQHEKEARALKMISPNSPISIAFSSLFCGRETLLSHKTGRAPVKVSINRESGTGSLGISHIYLFGRTQAAKRLRRRNKKIRGVSVIEFSSPRLQLVYPFDVNNAYYCVSHHLPHACRRTTPGQITRIYINVLQACDAPTKNR
jgi:hypothetical protein